MSESEEEDKHEHIRLWVTLLAVPFLVAAWLSSWFNLPENSEIVLDGTALAVASAPVVFDALRGIRLHPFNADVLMTIAAVGAAAIGAWHEGAAVILLYNIAESVEEYTVDRVRNIAKRVAGLIPQRALVKEKGELLEIAVEDIRPGDLIVVKPGWRIPVDGKIVAGRSTIDQSTVTGESIPVEMGPRNTVLSGTLNVAGSIEVVAEKPFINSTVSRIVQLVTEAQEKKANIERFIDRFSRYYTPSMLGLAVLIALVPPFVLMQPFSTWLYRALIVLIIACPSALVIATPVTVLMGLTRAMWSGILIKGGMYLEEMSRVKAIAFDKTGTLTQGRLRVSRIVAFDGFSEKEVLRLGATTEFKSTHPIGAAIVAEARRLGIPMDSDVAVVDVAGMGVATQLLSGDNIVVGKPEFLDERGIDTKLLRELQASATIVGVGVDDRLAGAIIVEDQIRQEAKRAVEQIKRLGIDRVVMVTGDTRMIAKAIAAQLGVSEYHAELLPEDKVEVAKKLKQQYGSIAMVGDGINDAPVLAASNVGIALGTAGNDVAIEAADIALMGSDLNKIPYLIALGRKVVSKLKVNIVTALGIKLLLIVLGAMGMIPLWFAVIGDDGLTLLIVANGLPLLRYVR